MQVTVKSKNKNITIRKNITRHDKHAQAAEANYENLKRETASLVTYITEIVRDEFGASDCN